MHDAQFDTNLLQECRIRKAPFVINHRVGVLIEKARFQCSSFQWECVVCFEPFPAGCKTMKKRTVSFLSVARWRSTQQGQGSLFLERKRRKVIVMC